ncbi:MAG: haloacid dehalogenase type II [Ginsengibacter sp.]
MKTHPWHIIGRLKVFLFLSVLIAHFSNVKASEKKSILNSIQIINVDTIKKPIVILFDVNETLMDLTPLKKKVNALLSNNKGFQVWFGMLLQYSLVDNHTEYHDFSAIASATLDMAAYNFGVHLSATSKHDALSEIKKLKAYPDVSEGLHLLKEAGFKLATLTNSPLSTLTAQLESAGIKKYFEATLSIDQVKKYKPAPESYEYAAKTLGVNRDEIIMVAAHGWDIAGALHSGLKAAFIEREGQALYPLSTQPQFKGRTLTEVAKQIINTFASKK